MTGETVRMSFSVNGQDQGVAFEVPSGKLNDQALFPHILSKNSRFACNFGSAAPWFAPTDDKFVLVSALDKEQLSAGPKRPASKTECEVSFQT